MCELRVIAEDAGLNDRLGRRVVSVDASACLYEWHVVRQQFLSRN